MSMTCFSGTCVLIRGMTILVSVAAFSKNTPVPNLPRNMNISDSVASWFFGNIIVCLKDSLCLEDGIVLSATSEKQNVWYISTGNTITMIEFEINSRSCNCTNVFEATVPGVGCYLPQVTPPDGNLIGLTQNAAEFNISDVVRWKEKWLGSPICRNVLIPNVKLGFYFFKLRSMNISAPPSLLSAGTNYSYQPVSFVSSFGRVLLRNLQPNSVYQIYLAVSIVSGEQKSFVVSNGIKITTPCKEHYLTIQPKCVGINNTALLVSWNHTNDVDQVMYDVSVINDTTGTMDRLVNRLNVGQYIHGGLEYKNYTYLIKARHISCQSEPKPYSETRISNCVPFRNPMTVIGVFSTNQSFSVLWRYPADNSVKNIVIEWMDISNPDTVTWSSSSLLQFSGSFIYTIPNLKCNTGYKIRTSQQYVGYKGSNGWFTSDSIIVKTKPGIPGYPYNVTVNQKYNTAFLSWSKPNDNGSPILGYIIWCRNGSTPSLYSSHIKWRKVITIFSLKTPLWKLQDLPFNLWYQFKVSALNLVGEGEHSNSSDIIFYQKQPAEDTSDIIGVITGVAVFLLSLIIAIAAWHCHSRYNSLPATIIAATSLNEDVEAIPTPELFIHPKSESSISTTLELPTNVPLLSSEKLELVEFLGKGAFGEVYEGIAYGIGEEPGLPTRVAVKTLKETSTGKKDILMEARVMSKFHHKNILSLLGMCWEDDQQSLVMELMEGGDLSHYLREAKPTSITVAKLSTVDLIDICLDIAAGCRYLEEQHYIHRDLAARNCLVSTKDYSAKFKIVKIGDFGLARDIYRSDYYHKHGDGLLPVRWMAPESLEQNIYTTQSDVWSFGILLWEVMSFGSRPYQILNDIEILTFIKAGGRLEKPEHCPEPMYLLMTKCWLNSPIFRPSFAWTLEYLHNVKDAYDGISDSDSDILRGTYGTASTSDEDVADDSIHTSQGSHSSSTHPR